MNSHKKHYHLIGEFKYNEELEDEEWKSIKTVVKILAMPFKSDLFIYLFTCMHMRPMLR